SSNRAGTYTFDETVTSSRVGKPYAAFPLGLPGRTGLGLVNMADSNGHAIHYAAYVQDDWKATPRLTINYGMRWEYHPPFVDGLRNLAVFVPDVYSVIDGVTVHGIVAVPDDAPLNPLFAASIAPTPIRKASEVGLPQELHRSQKTSFAPRTGFAWPPFADGKTVVRG